MLVEQGMLPMLMRLEFITLNKTPISHCSNQEYNFCNARYLCCIVQIRSTTSAMLGTYVALEF